MGGVRSEGAFTTPPFCRWCQEQASSYGCPLTSHSWMLVWSGKSTNQEAQVQVSTLSF